MAEPLKILVTGANGQVGQHLRLAFKKSSWPTTLLTHNDLDITDPEAVLRLITQHLPNIVINAAAYTAVDKAETHPDLAYATNAHGAGLLASAAKSVNAAIIHISTDYVFSGGSKETYNEEAHPAPVNIYGQSKYAGEIAVAEANPRHIILRTSWLFSEYGNNFLQTMRRLARDKSEISVVDDQFGGPTYAGDLVTAILKIIDTYQKKQQLDWGIYHYCGHPHVSWLEFAQEIANQDTSLNIKPISSAKYGSTTQRPINSRLDCSKIQKEFGVEPSDWKSAVRTICGRQL